MAAGIFSSRVFGLIREGVIAFAFGAGAHGDVLSAVMRGPNLLQQLLGEQTLSASFIPVYSRMLEEGREEEAGRLAGAIFGLLLAVAGGLSLLGILLAEPIVTLLSPGFLADAERVAAGQATVDRFPLAVAAVRITFPMAAVLVLSAWALGILNSHRRFFLPYFAPVLWNAAIIGALLALALGLPADAPGRLDRVLFAACWGGLAGGLLQFGVQLPLAGRLLRGFRLSLSHRVAGVRRTLRAAAPMLGARGAVQLSAYVDQVLASLLAAGAVVSLRYGSILYLLPFSLFAASVAAAELPELSRRRDDGEPATVERAETALRQIAFLVVPTVAGYLAFGFVIVGGVYRRGSFEVGANWLVYLILCGYSIGLLAAAWSRLLQNVFFSLHDTRTPAAISIGRMTFSALLGLGLMLPLDRWAVAGLPGASPSALRLGALGLALAGGVAAWSELGLLRRALRRRLPSLRLPWGRALAMLGLAVLAALPAAGVWLLLRDRPAWAAAPATVVSYAAVYLGVAVRRGWPEVAAWLGRVRPAGGGHAPGDRS